MPRTITFTIQEGDILTYKADVLALKFAQSFHGADAVVATRFVEAGKFPSLNQLRVKANSFKMWDSEGVVAANRVLFIATPPPKGFTYEAISEYAAKTLDILKAQQDVRHIASTIHGVGFGLDEVDAAIAQVNGYLLALLQNNVAPNLERITLVERYPRRVERLHAVLNEWLAQEHPSIKPLADGWGYELPVGDSSELSLKRETVTLEIEQEATRIEAKQHVFIAMPFRPEFEDLYYYAIQSTIRASGLQAHRIDQSSFSGDIFEQIKYQIETSAALIALLDGSNPNVLLELGYAMGLKRPVILIVDNVENLPFDVKGQRCIVYNGAIRTCEEKLTDELKNFRKQGII